MPTPSVRLKKIGRTVKLGRKPKREGKEVLQLVEYLEPSARVAQPPPAVDYSAKAKASLSRMYLNDTYGDCVIAGEAHAIGVESGNSATEAVFQDKDIQEAYFRICGPGDNGCVITDVLDAQQQGQFIGNHKIAGYVEVDNANQQLVKWALWQLGTLTLGINLPGAWADNTAPGFVWDNTNSGSVGGHEVILLGYNAAGCVCETWGMVGTMTWAALANKSIVDECYAKVANDWLNAGGRSPLGLDLPTLLTDLQDVGGGTVPPDGPPQPPPPPPPPGPPGPPPSGGNVLFLSSDLPAGSYPLGSAGGGNVVGADLQAALDKHGLRWDGFQPVLTAFLNALSALEPATRAHLAGLNWQQLLALLMQLLQLLAANKGKAVNALPWQQLIALLLQLLQLLAG